ncbi:MAG: phosphatase PAP2 family protein [Acidobacteriia bacterium]|nr:phosphatase PAP2 family protein [Terriglobia bacterium]
MSKLGSFGKKTFRRSEVVAMAYFLYAGVVAVVRPVNWEITFNVLWLNLTVVGSFCLLAYADSFRRRRLLGSLRDWLPLPLLLLAYREMGWFALPHSGTELEQSWIVWDRMVLDDWGGRALIESAGAVLPSVLEISYALVYAVVPGGLGTLYLTGHRKVEDVDRFLFTVLLATFGAYALFPYFPSEPPRAVFPGQDLPGVITIFRKFNLGYLGRYGIHTSVFPSAHVSTAFAVAFGIRLLVRERPWVGRLFLMLAILIATATVYGRYHYLVDALAGLGLAIAARAALQAVLERDPLPVQPK